MRAGPIVALKMLVSPKEAGTLIGKGWLVESRLKQAHSFLPTSARVLAGGATQRQISEITGCNLHLSGMNELYPGTQMQEVACHPCQYR